MELLEVGGAGVGAATPYAGHDGVNEVLDAGAFRVKVHASGRNALLEERRTRPIEARGILGAHLHCPRGSHPVRLLVHPSFRVGHQVASALIRSGEPGANHHAASPRSERKSDITRVADAAVSPD